MAIAIVGAARTPMGGLGGALSNIPATELGGVAIKAAMDGATLNLAASRSRLLWMVQQ